jgi:hypothetical protein
MTLFPKILAVEKCKDAGLALVLIFLLCFQAWKLETFLLLAIIFLLAAMTYPLIFKPFAKIWFALSTALGTIVSKVLLTVLFFALVLPIGMVRRISGKDSMQLKDWKRGNQTVFRSKNHRFVAKDLEHPF